MTVRGEESRQRFCIMRHKTTEFEGGGYRRQYMVGRGLSSDRVESIYHNKSNLCRYLG